MESHSTFLEGEDLQWLSSRLSAVIAGLGVEGTDFITTLQQIDAWRDAHRSRVPRDLEHFLTQRSYTKAIEWLSTQEPAQT